MGFRFKGNLTEHMRKYHHSDIEKKCVMLLATCRSYEDENTELRNQIAKLKNSADGKTKATDESDIKLTSMTDTLTIEQIHGLAKLASKPLVSSRN